MKKTFLLISLLVSFTIHGASNSKENSDHLKQLGAAAAKQNQQPMSLADAQNYMKEWDGLSRRKQQWLRRDPYKDYVMSTAYSVVNAARSFPNAPKVAAAAAAAAAAARAPQILHKPKMPKINEEAGNKEREESLSRDIQACEEEGQFFVDTIIYKIDSPNNNSWKASKVHSFRISPGFSTGGVLRYQLYEFAHVPYDARIVLINDQDDKVRNWTADIGNETNVGDHESAEGLSYYKMHAYVVNNGLGGASIKKRKESPMCLEWHQRDPRADKAAPDQYPPLTGCWWEKMPFAAAAFSSSASSSSSSSSSYSSSSSSSSSAAPYSGAGATQPMVAVGQHQRMQQAGGVMSAAAVAAAAASSTSASSSSSSSILSSSDPAALQRHILAMKTNPMYAAACAAHAYGQGLQAGGGVSAAAAAAPSSSAGSSSSSSASSSSAQPYVGGALAQSTAPYNPMLPGSFQHQHMPNAVAGLSLFPVVSPSDFASPAQRPHMQQAAGVMQATAGALSLSAASTQASSSSSSHVPSSSGGAELFINVPQLSLPHDPSKRQQRGKK